MNKILFIALFICQQT